MRRASLLLIVVAGLVVVAATWWWAGQEAPPPSAGSVAACRSPVRIAVLGASYAKGWRVSGEQIELINLGVEGNESPQMLDRFERDVVSVRPRAVIVWGFINDIFRSPRDRIDETVQRTRQTLRAIVLAARQSGIEPIIATELTIRGPKSLFETALGWVGGVLGRVSYQDYINAQVRAVNAELRTLAAAEQLLLLDFERVLADARGRRAWALAADDGSHVSEAGYSKLTEYAVPLLAGYFCATEGAPRPRVDD